MRPNTRAIQRPVPSRTPLRPAASNLAATGAAAFAAALASAALLFQRPMSAPVPAQAPKTTTAAVTAPEPLSPWAPLTPQYEDGLAPLSMFAAAAVVEASSSAARAAGPFVSLLPAYRGRTLAAESAIRRTAFSSMRLLRFASLAQAAAEEAAAEDAASSAGAQILAHQKVEGARNNVNAAHASAWTGKSKAEQEQWAETWQRGARAAAKAQAAAQGKTIEKMETGCVGHTDKCTIGELEVTYADGTHETLKYDPLVFDLAGKGFRATGATVDVDLDGDGRTEPVADLAPGLGLLVFDNNKDGVSGANPGELFSAISDLNHDRKPDNFADGFDALNALVRKAVREGALPASVLTSMRLGSSELEALQKSCGLKIRVGGFNAAPTPLLEAGVREIGLTAKQSVRENSFDGRGTDIIRRSGAVFARADGSIGDYADLWLGRTRLWDAGPAR